MTKSYYLGQIKGQYRGDLVAVVSEESGKLETFSFPIFSEEIIFLTGSTNSKEKTHRVYIGVSRELVDKISQLTYGKKKEGFDFRSALDSLVVNSYFLNKDEVDESRKYRGWDPSDWTPG